MHVVQRVIVMPNSLSISRRPYHEQGDPSMYTAESLAAREALRSAPVVIDAVARFSMLYRLDADRFVPWSEYRRVHTAAALILAPGVPPREVGAASHQPQPWPGPQPEA